MSEFEWFYVIFIVLFILAFMASVISLIVSTKKEKAEDKALYLSLPFALYLVILIVLMVIAPLLFNVKSPDGYAEIPIELSELGTFLYAYEQISYFMSVFFSPMMAILSFWFAYKHAENRIWWNVSGVISVLSICPFLYLDPIVRPILVIWFIGKKIKGMIKWREWLG